jgi:hypothetical protein
MLAWMLVGLAGWLGINVVLLALALLGGRDPSTSGSRSGANPL